MISEKQSQKQECKKPDKFFTYISSQLSKFQTLLLNLQRKNPKE